MTSFGLGLGLGLALNHHRHYDDYYQNRPSYHYHSSSTTVHNYGNDGNGGNNNNNNNGGNNNGGNNNNGYPNNGGNNNNNNGNPNNNNYGNNGPNNVGTGPYQNTPYGNNNNNGTAERSSPFEQPPPLVYSIGPAGDSNSDDSTEVQFTDSYLIVGVENLLLYGEFHDDEDIKIIIQQDSDGLTPYPWNTIPYDEPNATSAGNGTAPIQNQFSNSTMSTGLSNGDTTTVRSVPLAPLP